MNDVGYTMVQGLGVFGISKGVMNGKSPYERERSPKPERSADKERSNWRLVPKLDTNRMFAIYSFSRSTYML